MAGLGRRLLLEAWAAGLEVGIQDGQLHLRGTQVHAELAEKLLQEKDEVLAALMEEQAGLWPTQVWGPLLPEHFAIRTLDDLGDVPVVSGGFKTTGGLSEVGQ